MVAQPRPVKPAGRRWLLLVPLVLGCGPFFYQAPPALNHYLSRTPGKSWGLLADEHSPPNTDDSKSLRSAAAAVLDAWEGTAAADRTRAIDDLATRNRNARRLDVPLANLLLEARELVAEDDAVVADYLRGRLAQPGGPAMPSRPFQGWDEDDESFAKRTKKFEEEQREAIRRSGLAMGAAPRVLAPYLRTRHAVLLTHLRRHEAARALYESIPADFPGHPRAEVAAFMIGRLWLEQAKLAETTPEDRAACCDSASTAFGSYLDAFPEGRFRGDATGWLGGVAEVRGNLGEAIDLQVRRLGMQPTREALHSVLRECDQLIAAIVRQAGDSGYLSENESYLEAGLPDFDLLATQPAVLRLFLFHCLDPSYQIHFPVYSDNSTGDRGTLRFLENRIIRPSAFTQDALRLAARAVAARADADHAPDALLILGWSALRQSEAAQALILFDRGIAIRPGDELLHARAVALDDLGRPADAAAAYATLAERFPDSPLAAASGFDHAIAMHLAGRSGEALLKLWDILGKFDPPEVEARPSHRPENEVLQWIDSIAQFAPIDSLAAPLANLNPAWPAAAELRAIVRMRALSTGDFATAERWLDPAPMPADTAERWSNRWEPRDFIGIDAGRWAAEIAPLAKLLASPRTPAKELEAARLWESLRGRLTLPLHGIGDYSGSEEAKLDQLRRINGRVLGFEESHITRELDSRDELQHALDHYLAAAKSTDPEIAAPALEGANEALRRLAEFSLYRCGRATETDATAHSARLVAELHRRFPGRPETKRAVAFRFTPSPLIADWMPGDYNPANCAWILAGTLRPNDVESSLLSGEEIHARVLRLAREAATPAAFREGLAAIAADFAKLRPQLDGETLNTVSDNLHDLAAAAAVPDVPIDVLKDYCMRRIQGAAAADATGPLAAFEAFRLLRDNLEAGAADWQAYLERWPDSPKTVAAALRLLRFEVRANCPVPQIRAFHFPEAPIAAGYKRATLPTGPTPAEPFDPAALLARIAAYRKAHPDNPYAKDVDMLEAAVHTRNHDPERTLALILPILDDPAHPELHGDAGLHLAFIAQDLLDPRTRQPVLDALGRHPTAIPWISKLAEGDTFLFRLLPFMGQLGGS